MAISGIFSVLWTFLSSIWHLLLTKRLLTALRLPLSMTPRPCGDSAIPCSNDSVLPDFFLSSYETDSEQCPGTCGNPHISFLVFGRAFFKQLPRPHCACNVATSSEQMVCVFNPQREMFNNVFALTYFSLFYVYSETMQCSRTHSLNS